MSAPHFTPDLVAIVDREHARARDFLDCFPEHAALITDDARFPTVARLIVLDCLSLSNDPGAAIYRLAGWEQLLREHLGDSA